MLKTAFLGIIGISFWGFSGWQLIHAAHYGAVRSGVKGSARYYTFDDSAFWFIFGISLYLLTFLFLTCLGFMAGRQFLHDRWLKQFRRDHSQPW